MEWLGGWLKSVILIILLATFMDLLLPNHSMQRYVKTVISLFIVMTLLSPVFALFQHDWDVNKLIGEAWQKQEKLSQLPDPGRKEPPSLAAIMQESRQLAANNRLQAQQLMETRVADAIKQQIETEEQQPVQSVEVQTAVDGQGNATIRHIRVNLARGDPERTPANQAYAGPDPSQPALGAPLQIEPVKPVHIGIGGIDARAPLDRESASANGGKPASGSDGQSASGSDGQSEPANGRQSVSGNDQQPASANSRESASADSQQPSGNRRQSAPATSDQPASANGAAASAKKPLPERIRDDIRRDWQVPAGEIDVTYVK